MPFGGKSDPLDLSHEKPIVWEQVNSVEFGFFNDKEMSEMAVVRVTNPVTFDVETGIPLKKGLHDPVMGTAKLQGEMFEFCKFKKTEEK